MAKGGKGRAYVKPQKATKRAASSKSSQKVTRKATLKKAKK